VIGSSYSGEFITVAKDAPPINWRTGWFGPGGNGRPYQIRKGFRQSSHSHRSEGLSIGYV
jgi:hypothetical protein